MKSARMLWMVAVLTAVGVFSLLSHRAAAQSNLPWVGKWTLNVAKSRYTGTPPRSGTRTYQAFQGDGLKYLSETVQADGSRAIEEYSGRIDGKDVPWTGTPTPEPNTIGEFRLDSNAFAFVLKKNGQVIARGINAISQDGKTMTITGVNGQGAAGNVMVYDKQ
jgi:hypothetical protein